MKANSTKKTKYDGRILEFKKVDEILVVWIAGDPFASFEVKRRSRGDIFAYGFNGDFSISEIAKAKKIFKEYEEL